MCDLIVFGLRHTLCRFKRCARSRKGRKTNGYQAKVLLPSINRTDIQTFDFVIIDGAYRMACVVAAMPKIKSGGYLLIDNSNWMELDRWGVPPNWKMVHSSVGFEGTTTLWQKP